MKAKQWIWIIWGVLLLFLALVGVSYAAQIKRRKTGNGDLLAAGLANSNSLLILKLKEQEAQKQKLEFTDEFNDEFL